MLDEALVDSILHGPDPRVVAWLRDPQPFLPLTPEEAALHSNPPTPPRVAPIQARYTPPPVPEGVDKDVVDDLLDWFHGDGARVLGVLDLFPSGCSGFETEQASLAAEGYSDCREQGRIPKCAPVADDATAAYAVDVAMGRAHAKSDAERATNVAQKQAYDEYHSSPAAVAYRDMRTRIAIHQSPEAVAARIQANGERVTGFKSYADFLKSHTVVTPDGVSFSANIAASIVLLTY